VREDEAGDWGLEADIQSCVSGPWPPFLPS